MTDTPETAPQHRHDDRQHSLASVFVVEVPRGRGEPPVFVLLNPAAVVTPPRRRAAAAGTESEAEAARHGATPPAYAYLTTLFAARLVPPLRAIELRDVRLLGAMAGPADDNDND